MKVSRRSFMAAVAAAVCLPAVPAIAAAPPKLHPAMGLIERWVSLSKDRTEATVMFVWQFPLYGAKCDRFIGKGTRYAPRTDERILTKLENWYLERVYSDDGREHVANRLKKTYSLKSHDGKVIDHTRILDLWRRDELSGAPPKTSEHAAIECTLEQL